MNVEHLLIAGTTGAIVLVGIDAIFHYTNAWGGIAPLRWIDSHNIMYIAAIGFITAASGYAATHGIIVK